MHHPEATYKFMFQDASWQDRKFISLTKIESNGSARVLNCVFDSQMSFGTYAPLAPRKIEFKPSQTVLTTLGSSIPSEAALSKFFNEDILQRILHDKDFLTFLERQERVSNHEVMIEAAQDLQMGVCRTSIGRIGGTLYPDDYREYVVDRYFHYLLNCDAMRINADLNGLFTEIHVCAGSIDTSVLGHGGLNAWPVKKEVADNIRLQMQMLYKLEFPPYPASIQPLFLGRSVPYVGNGMYLEITDPTTEQIQVIDALFDFAAENNFFPEDPKAMLRNVWNANSARMPNYKPVPLVAPAATPSFWGAGSSALLSANAAAPSPRFAPGEDIVHKI